MFMLRRSVRVCQAAEQGAEAGHFGRPRSRSQGASESQSF